MPYTDDGKFYHDRRLDHGDTGRMAAEKLALHVETYLFEEDAPGYMRPEFLSWALSVYDATKNSSGNVVVPEFDDDLVKLSPIPEGKTDTLDRSVRFSDDARKSPNIDTDMDRAADNGFPLHADSEPPVSAEDGD